MAERIKEVWANNLDEEMSYLRAAIEKYPFVAMVRLPLPLSRPSCLPIPARRRQPRLSAALATPRGHLADPRLRTPARRTPSSPASSPARSARSAARATTTTRRSGATSTCCASSSSASRCATRTASSRRASAPGSLTSSSASSASLSLLSLVSCPRAPRR